MHYVSVYMYPYSSIHTSTAWKKLHFILSDRFDFNMIDNQSRLFHVFAYVEITFRRWDAAAEVCELVY